MALSHPARARDVMPLLSTLVVIRQRSWTLTLLLDGLSGPGLLLLLSVLRFNGAAVHGSILFILAD